MVKRAKVMCQGDIAQLGCRMQKKSCRYLLPLLSGCSTRREVGPGVCIWGPNYWEEEDLRRQRRYHSKERYGGFYCDHCLTIRSQFAIECL